MGTYTDFVRGKGPRAFYPLNGAATADLSGNGYTATLNSISTGQGGFVYDNNALMDCILAGTTTASAVSIPAAAIPSSGSITIEFWAKKNAGAAATGNSIFEVGSTSGYRMLNIHLEWTDGNIYWDAGQGITSTGDWDRLTKAADFDVTLWHHYAFIKDVAAGTMTIFVDGIQWATNGGYTKTLGTASQANIGNYSVGGANTPFPGNISNFAIYNRALTANEIQRNYMEGRSTRVGKTVTVTYPYLNRVGAFVGPPGVTTVHVAASGASGGDGNGARGGYGLKLMLDMKMTAGELWRIQPGGRGQDQVSAGQQSIAGWPNGGRGGQGGGNVNGAAGGGYSRIYRDSDSLQACSAGGGGGAGSHSYNGGESGQGGDAGYTTGGDGGRGKNLVNGDMGYVGMPGTGGTATAGGAGGIGTSYGGTGSPYAGGGGSSAFGGGGGGNNAAGYGGSGGGGGGGDYGGGGGGGGNQYGGGSGGGAGCSTAAGPTLVSNITSALASGGNGVITMTYDEITTPYVPAMML